MLKSILTGLALVLIASSANAQCSGQPASATVCGNPTAGVTLPSWATQTVMLDRAFGSTQGTVLNRGASVWAETSGPSLGKNGGAGGTVVLNGATSGLATIGVNSVAGSTSFILPVGNGSNGFTLHTDGAGNTSWSTAGSGTVTSVGLALPNIFTVSGSPVTVSGTLTGSLATEAANSVWAGPTTGAASTPTFRALVGADLPNPALTTLGGIEAINAVASNWIRSISTSGVPALSQPAFSDISGSITPAQCPNPSASTIGCVESYVAVAHQWINTISTSGVPSSTQPAFTDISGSATLAQLPSISNNSILANNSGGTAIPSTLSTSQVLDMINNVQGDVLYRNATGWVALAPGTSGQVFTTGGTAANPAWATVSGTGTLTSLATNNGITGGTITTTGTIGLATITAGTVLANITGGSAIPIANTPSSILDLIGSTAGNILYRTSGSGWAVLAPGTNGQVLTQGASTPAWGNAGTLTNVTIAGAGLVANSGTCNISTTGTCTLTTTAASKSDEQTGTSAIVATTPSQQQQHDSAAKAWCLASGTATGSNACTISYNVSSITRNSAGNYTANFATPWASATSYSCVAMASPASGGTNVFTEGGGALATTASSYQFFAISTAGAATDTSQINIVCYGRQ